MQTDSFLQRESEAGNEEPFSAARGLRSGRQAGRRTGKRISASPFYARVSNRRGRKGLFAEQATGDANGGSDSRCAGLMSRGRGDGGEKKTKTTATRMDCGRAGRMKEPS